MSYLSPIATVTNLGNIQVGTGLSITPQGLLSAATGGTFGTWTPVLIPAAGAIAVSNAGANYFKIGQLVFCTFDITVTSGTGAGADTISLGGFPFASLGGAAYVGSVFISYFQNMNVDTTVISGSVVPASTTATLWQNTEGGGRTMSVMTRGDVKITTRLAGTAHYLAAN